MARSEAGRLLTESHRRRQLTIRSGVVRDLLGLWSVFSLADIDESWQSIEPAVFSVLLNRRRESAVAAGAYFQAFRVAERVTGPASPVLAGEPDPIRTLATLRLLGPIATKKSISRGVADPAATALVRITGSVSRQALNGGRETLLASMRADTKARGWRRVTDSSPCKFCADIAREGVIGTSVDFPAHDHCGCTQEPAY